MMWRAISNTLYANQDVQRGKVVLRTDLFDIGQNLDGSGCLTLTSKGIQVDRFASLERIAHFIALTVSEWISDVEKNSAGCAGIVKERASTVTVSTLTGSN